jgi:hypothetical protein
MATDSETPAMSQGRGLLTESERDALAGNASDSYEYKTRSYVRSRLEKLAEDVKVLEEHDQELLGELREVVCPTQEDGIAATGSFEDGVVNGVRTDTEAKEDVYEDLKENTEPPEGSAEAEEILRGLDSLSGSGSKYEGRVNAVLAFYEYLRDHRGERVSRGVLEDVADDADLDLGYASFGSFWGNWVKANDSQGRDFNTLAQLPGVEMDGDDYVYTGESE